MFYLSLLECESIITIAIIKIPSSMLYSVFIINAIISVCEFDRFFALLSAMMAGRGRSEAIFMRYRKNAEFTRGSSI